MARVFYHKINQEYIADASTLHLLAPLAIVLTHPGKAQMQASILQVVQLRLGDCVPRDPQAVEPAGTTN